MTTPPVAQLTDIPSAATAITQFIAVYHNNLPSALQEYVVSSGSSLSAVDQICNTAEALYANLASITDAATLAAAQTLVCQLAVFGAMYSWHLLGVNGRGFAIANAMQRDLGIAAPPNFSWPDAAADPAGDARFLPSPPMVNITPQGPAAALAAPSTGTSS
jgi:hypothetical protein